MKANIDIGSWLTSLPEWVCSVLPSGLLSCLETTEMFLALLIVSWMETSTNSSFYSITKIILTNFFYVGK